MVRAEPDTNVVERFAPLFTPRTVAVVGASSSGITFANEFIRHSRNMGYTGRICPIHPSADKIEGLQAYRSFAEIGDEVDYAYIAIGAGQVPAVLASAGGRVRYAQVMSSGFGEAAGGQALERKLVEAAREGGVRVLGPNCLGVHSPRGRITFVGGADPEPGPVGIVSQSGGLAVDIILRGQVRGLRYSGLVTIGNSADLTPSDFLEYYLADRNTRVIGMYLEDVKDGRRFFTTLRDSGGAKPVVLLVGGRTRQGQRAAVSHTGSLAADARIWNGLARQTGVVLVETLEAFLDTLLAFQSLTPRGDRPTEQVVLFGNGGGTSVLAADCFARSALALPPVQGEAKARLEALKLPPGTSLDNPIDAPAGTLRVEEGRIAEKILDTIYEVARPDAVVLHINLPVFLSSENQQVDVVGNLMQSATRVLTRFPHQAHFLLVLRSDGEARTEERRRLERARATRLGIPVFDELSNAAAALAAVAAHERFISSRNA
jgi:acyl-CoA synthetase (NDP forming)